MKVIITMLILLAGGFGGLAFILSPAGKATVSFITAKLQSAPVVVASIDLPKPSEDELMPPLMKGETEETKAASAPASTAPAETGPDDTFERVMAIYEEDGKVQKGDNVSKD